MRSGARRLVPKVPTNPSPWSTSLLSAAAVGLAAGVMSGLLGVGGGLVMVPAMVGLLGFTQHQAHGTSLAAILPIAAAAVVVFGTAGSVSVVGGLLLALGSIPGARLGATWMRRLPERTLRLGFGVFLLVVAAAMFPR
ncbi:MAG: sulfite exporter TauE/SafE family protein [Actinobacteria bacterium]|nr:sulfite exporter TauE/SafE family protein [Actinomycetota bacterium]